MFLSQALISSVFKLGLILKVLGGCRLGGTQLTPLPSHEDQSGTIAVKANAQDSLNCRSPQG